LIVGFQTNKRVIIGVTSAGGRGRHFFGTAILEILLKMDGVFSNGAGRQNACPWD